MAACECGENLLTKIFIGEYHDLSGTPVLIWIWMAKHTREFHALAVRDQYIGQHDSGKNRIREQYIFTGWWFGTFFIFP